MPGSRAALRSVRRIASWLLTLARRADGARTAYEERPGCRLGVSWGYLGGRWGQLGSIRGSVGSMPTPTGNFTPPHRAQTSPCQLAFRLLGPTQRTHTMERTMRGSIWNAGRCFKGLARTRTAA